MVSNFGQISGKSYINLKKVKGTSQVDEGIHPEVGEKDPSRVVRQLIRTEDTDLTSVSLKLFYVRINTNRKVILGSS